MKRCLCDICQKEVLQKDTYEKIALLDESIFNKLQEQAQKLPSMDTYIDVKMSLIEDKIEAFQVCEECLSDKIFKYTDILYKEHRMVLEPFIQSNHQHSSDVVLKEQIDYSSCYCCNKKVNYGQGNDALYIKDGIFDVLRKDPKLLQKISMDKVEDLISENTVVVNVCDECMTTEINNRHAELETYGLALSTQPPAEFNNGGSNNMNPQREYEDEHDSIEEDEDEEELETPTLDSLATRLTSDENIARIKKNRIFGRDKEVQSLINILSKADKNNPLLIGESGVGKTSVVHKLALNIYEGEVPSELFHKEIYEVRLADLVAGTKYRGDLENRMKALLAELKNNPHIILFMDEIHQLMGAGSSSGNDTIDVKDMLKPALSNGEITVIGVTTTNEYKKTIENDSALRRRFQLIQVKEPTVEDTLQLLNNTKKKYEQHHGIKIKSEVIEEAIKLSKRYVTDRNLPDKAFDLIDQAGALLKVEKDTLAIKEYIDRNKQLLNDIKYREFHNESEREELVKDLKDMNRTLGKDLVLDISYIHKVLKDWTGIEVAKMSNSDSDNLKELPTILGTRVIGQENATSVVAKYIKKAKVGLQSPNKPLGVYLLVGPTGTGKTELAKVTNDILKTNFIQIDLSEYSEKHEVSKLIGSPPGYVGHEEGGLLTEQVKRNPNSVILFDEIEKAHPDFMNILLQVCDEGRLTDSRGNRIDFKNTMIFMTSNIIVDNKEVNKSIGFGSTPSNVEKQQDTDKKKLLQSLFEKGLKKEFINRIDEVILFNELTEDAINKICVQKLDKKFEEIALHNQYISSCTYDNNVVEFIVQKGYQKEYGARPINRAIESYVGDSLTDFLIEENVVAKRKKINCKITVKDNKVVIEKV